MAAEAPRVFISYSHDSPAHRDRVLAFGRSSARSRRRCVDRPVHSIAARGLVGMVRGANPQSGFRADRFVPRRICDGLSAGRSRDVGHGVLWEARLIRQELSDAGSASSKFVPVLFADGSPDHVPDGRQRRDHLPGRNRRRSTSELYRLLTGQPDDAAGTARATPRAATAAAASVWRCRCCCFIRIGAKRRRRSRSRIRGRPICLSGGTRSLERLEALLFPSGGMRRPVVVSGMAGVGKSYLVDRFYWDHQDKFPGGYLRLSLDPEKLVSAAELIAQLADRLKLPAGDAEALRNRLLAVPSLVHIENADEDRRPAASSASWRRACPDARSRSARVFAGSAPAPDGDRSNSGRSTKQARWNSSRKNSRPNCWPMRWGSKTGPSLLPRSASCRWRCTSPPGICARATAPPRFCAGCGARGLALEHPDPADPVWRQRSRALISDTFELSLDALTRSGGDRRGRRGGRGSRRSGTRRPPVSATASGPRSPVSTPMRSTTWFRRRGGCRCSTGWRAARARRIACIRCLPNWSAAAPTATRFSAG